jgi:PAS domain S-box-containing protein
MQKLKKIKSISLPPTKHALQQMADTMPQLVWICNSDGRVIYYNKRIQEYTDTVIVDASPFKWESLIHPEDLASTSKAWKKAMRNGKPYMAEHRLQLVDGSYQWHLSRAFAERDENNQIIHWYGTATNIDNQKKNELALLESEMRYKQLINGLSVAIFTCDLKGNILAYNNAAVELWGRVPISGVDKWSGAYRIYNKDGTPLPHDQIPMALTLTKGKSVTGDEMIIERPNGGRSFVQANPQLIFDSKGKIIGAVNLLIDTTDARSSYVNSARLAAIVDSSQDAIISKNLDGTITSWNPAAEKLFGYAPEEMIGSSITRLLPPDRLEEESRIIEQIKKGERVEHFNSIRVDKYGKMLDISLTISPIRDATGLVIGASKIARDITSQKKLNDALQESERKFRNIIERAPMGIVILQVEDLTFEMANEAYAKIIGKRENDLLGKKLFDLLPSLKNQGIKELLEEISTSNKSFSDVEFKVELERNGKAESAYFNFICHPLTENNKAKLILLINEVTNEVKARQILAESEKQFRNIVTKSPVAIAVIKVDGWVIERANQTLLDDIWKKPLSEVQNKKLLDVFPELADQSFIASLRLVTIEARGVKETECVTQLNTTEGWIKYYIDYDFLPLVEDGKVLGIMITMTDVTERVLARQKIEESEQRMNIAIESAQLGIWERDLVNGKITYSKEYLEILGYEKNVDLNHTQLLDHIHPDDKAIRSKKMQEACETGTLNFEMRILDTQKTERWIKVIGKVLFDEKKKPIRMFGTIQDITAQKAIETELEKRVKLRTEELQLANFKLENSNENLEQYAYVASHDLQEPLRKIRTYSSMLQMNVVGGGIESQRLLQKVVDSAERMSTLIYDLLNFSRLLKPETLFEPVDLNQIVQNVINDLELIISQKQATISFDELPVIEAIPLQMNQLFYNIINNALKFSKGDIPPILHLRCEKTSFDKENMDVALPIYYEITFVDNGIGFDQENADQIFEVFKRLHNKSAYSGSGIGLALCRKIVLNHQGNIFAESSEGNGAAFHVVLPASQKNAKKSENLHQHSIN